MKQSKIKSQHYSYLKMILRVLTLGISIWALVIAYQAKSLSNWVQDTQDKIIEKVLFPDTKIP